MCCVVCITSNVSKYCVTSDTNCSDRSSPSGRVSFELSAGGSAKRDIDDEAKERRRIMSYGTSVSQKLHSQRSTHLLDIS